MTLEQPQDRKPYESCVDEKQPWLSVIRVSDRTKVAEAGVAARKTDVKVIVVASSDDKLAQNDASQIRLPGT
jgi:hypothetical protein